MKPSKIPKLIEVRFTSTIKMAAWMEKDHRCLYLYFTWLLEEIKEGRHKDLTASEQIILREFLSNNIETRLCNKFLVDVTKPINQLIKKFEQEEPKIYEKFEDLSGFLYTIMSKFLKNAGLKENSGDRIRIKDLLDVDVHDPKLRLSKKNIYLGSKVEDFLLAVGLTRDSPELGSFFDGVFKFYMEAAQKAIKYFGLALESKLLLNMKVLNPKTFLAYSVDDLKSKYRYIAAKFDNIIKKNEIPDLLDQVASLKCHSSLEDFVNHPDHKPTVVYYKLETKGDGKFNLIGRLGTALLTVHNASTAVERDFSLQVRLLY